MSRRVVVRTVLRLAAACLAVALTVTLSRSPASGAFAAQTGSAANAVGSAADFCTSPGAVTLTAAGDTWINQQASGSTYGSDTTLHVQSGSSNNFRTLLRFSLPARPTGCHLTGATLRLYNRSPAPGRTIDVYRADPAAPQWSESTVTYATRPAGVGTPVGSITAATAGWQTWAVTAQVEAQYAGTDNGFLVRDAAEGAATSAGQVYEAREHATNGPRLVLTWS